MKVQLKFVGGGIGRCQKVLLLFLPLATKHWNLSRATKHWNLSRAPNIGTFQGHQTLEPFKGTKHWNLSRAPNTGTFHWPPSIGIFQGPPNNGTFHWPLSWDLPSPPSFSLSLKGEFGSFRAFFFQHNFRFES